MPEFIWHGWGFSFGKLHVCWWSLWDKKPAWEVSWF